MTRGIDISYGNLIADYSKVKSQGIQFAIIRSSYGVDQDSKYMTHVECCRKAGIQIAGIYVFCYALSKEDAIKEADYAVSLAKKAKLKNDIIIWYDLEYDSVRYAREMGVTLDKTRCIEWTRAFCERIKSLGYEPGIYCNLDYYRNMYDKDILNKYNIWLAHYTTGAPAYDCVYQQYSSTGQIAGINGNVDMDYCRVQIKSTVKSVTKTSKPITPAKSITQIAREVIAGKWGDGDTRKKKLKAAGYSWTKVQTEVNRIYASNCVDAETQFVEAVQKTCGAKVDGIPGPETLSNTVTVSVYTNNTHPVVNAILKYLAVLGYYKGAIDGVFGSGAKAATIVYQRDHDCVADGEITAGCKTWQKLLKIV